MKKVIVFAIAAMLLAGMASAQTCGLYGKNEIQFSAAWADLGDVNTTLVAAHYGRFVTPNLEAQLGLVWAKVDAFGADADAFAVAPAVAWHFIGPNTTNIVPYIGVGWYFFNVDLFGSDNENGLEAFAGAKFFLGGDYMTSNRAVFVEYRFFNDVLFNENINTVMVGITNFF